MAVTLVTGFPGTGKSLVSVARCLEYLEQGRRVVANFPVDFRHVCKPDSKAFFRSVEVLPDQPTGEMLFSLGRGGATEETSGLLVLDEVSLFLNSRGWNDKTREKMLDWFVHHRKLKWDVYLLAQAPSQLDKQVRDGICELTARLRRSDRFKIPFTDIKLPKIHYAIIRYGLNPMDAVADRWLVRRKDLYPCYDTSWCSGEYIQTGHYQMLTPAHFHAYKEGKKPVEFAVQHVSKPPHIPLIKRIFPAFAALIIGAGGSLAYAHKIPTISAITAQAVKAEPAKISETLKLQSQYSSGKEKFYILSDGRTLINPLFVLKPTGIYISVDNALVLVSPLERLSQ